MSGLAPPWRLAVAAALLVAVGAGLQRLVSSPPSVMASGVMAASAEPSLAPPPAREGAVTAVDRHGARGEDSGEVIDLEHLREADLNFLDEVLRDGSPAGRRSAIRALLASGDLRGAHLLLAFAADTDDSDAAALSCVAALEVLRLHRRVEVQRALLVALDRSPELPEGCVLELRDRFSLIRDDGRALAAAPEPEARRFAARALEQHDDDEARALLLALAADPDPTVRRLAWLVWQGRGLGEERTELSAIAESESDPDTQRLAAAALEPR